MVAVYTEVGRQIVPQSEASALRYVTLEWPLRRIALGTDTYRGRPWRYSVIPRTPDFQTEYQIRRYSNPAGIPVFAAIWGPDFRPSIIILTNMFKQIKQIRITLMTMFKVDPSPPNVLR